ncbi:Protein CBG17821 [Caenorhabditis briggsae]|uniref:Protein CBG17821 n=1 Tax=Caenorhabditis briggsae TaxID=6238 RepID=A8XRU7_CAEBR|nr:Protein CBG17821 [Caenorhabditis briggsae]CAP35373.1 Protein CBG17821 [Caenorhabditis briggsae]
MPFNNSTSYIHYAEKAKNISEFGFFFTSIFCAVLIYLTNFEVTRDFGSYKHLFLMFPVFGIIFATLEMILYPNAFSHNSGYIFYSTSRPFQLSQNATSWLLVSYSGIYSSTISNLAVQFLYRYWAIFDEKKIWIFKGWRLLICMLYSILFGFQWGLGTYYFDQIDDYSKNYFELEMMQKFSADFSNISGLILVAYDSNRSIRWRNVCCTINMTFIMLFQYSIIMYCAIRMYFEMESKVQILSPALRNLHRQFFKTLVLQVVTPTVTLFAPVTVLIYLPLFDLQLDLPFGIFLSTLSIFPGTDAIIVMYVVQDYRLAMKNMGQKFTGSIITWANSPSATVVPVAN